VNEASVLGCSTMMVVSNHDITARQQPLTIVSTDRGIGNGKEAVAATETSIEKEQLPRNQGAYRQLPQCSEPQYSLRSTA
jgi:hypothetical protein